jgi:tryptophanyl-tRNA synthetase
MADQLRKRILTGDRPTGKLHLGHYIGSHRNRLKFQEQYECFFLIADLHMLTTKPDKESIEHIAEIARIIVLDHLAIGIDPSKVTFYLQSAVHEVYELQLLLSSLVTVERLQQLPTIKDMAAAAGMEQIPYNLLGYPVLQAADILMPRANLVPVGKDNESHVELARQIARRFNNAYAEVFPLPDPFVEGGTLVGTDGQAKMSKSLDNAIFLRAIRSLSTTTPSTPTRWRWRISSSATAPATSAMSRSRRSWPSRSTISWSRPASAAPTTRRRPAMSTN